MDPNKSNLFNINITLYGHYHQLSHFLNRLIQGIHRGNIFGEKSSYREFWPNFSGNNFWRVKNQSLFRIVF